MYRATIVGAKNNKTYIQESETNEGLEKKIRSMVKVGGFHNNKSNDITYIIEQLDSDENLTIEEQTKYLNDTDWLVVRHRDEQDLGIETSINEETYMNLLENRQHARELIK